jgi:hypothetical protein
MHNKWFWKALLLGAVVLGFAAWQGRTSQLWVDDAPAAPTLADLRREKNMNTWQRSFVAVILVALWLLVGCTSNPALPTAGPTETPTRVAPSPAPIERDLPFETIERSDFSEYYQFHPSEPQRLFLITSAEGASRLIGWVSPQAQQTLAQLDYQRYFAIALFRGHFGSSGYDVIIQRVTRWGERLVVHVQFWVPSPYYAVTAANSKPYHVVKVLRDGGSLQEAELVLESQTLTPTPPPEIRRLTPTPQR